MPPGATATDLFLDGKDQQTIDRLAAMAPLERLGTPDDIAGAVAFLASPAGHWINGQVIRANAAASDGRPRHHTFGGSTAMPFASWPRR